MSESPEQKQSLLQWFVETKIPFLQTLPLADFNLEPIKSQHSKVDEERKKEKKERGKKVIDLYQNANDNFLESMSCLYFEL